MGHRFRYLDAPTPLAFAHRGGAAAGDENTTEAFSRAVALGYRYVETDVRATRDGVAVLFHDPTLERVTGQTGALAQLTWRDLATVRVGGEAAVPRLDEMLAGWPGLRFNLDAKADNTVEPIVAAVGLQDATDRVLLGSFDHARLRLLRRLAGPAVATSLSRREATRLRLASITGQRLALPGSAVAAQVPVRAYRLPVVDARFVRHAHRQGLQVHVWTIDDPDVMHRLLDLGVDGLMSDRIDVLREVYLDRGCWRPS